MKKINTRVEKIKRKLAYWNNKEYYLRLERDGKQRQLSEYCRRHRSMSYDGLETCNVKKLLVIYDYFDKKYPVEWEGGLRADDRGMRVSFWVADDPDYLILHITSTSGNICFSGSTSWLVKALTLEDKVFILKTIKKDISKILKRKGD